MSHTKNMSEGSPTRDILFFALPLILGYILQQMYLVIDAAIVGRILGVNALAAVGATSSIMFLIMGFCNGTCVGFSIPVAQSFGGGDYSKMRAYVASSIRITIILAFIITLFTAVFCHHIHIRTAAAHAAYLQRQHTILQGCLFQRNDTLFRIDGNIQFLDALRRISIERHLRNGGFSGHGKNDRTKGQKSDSYDDVMRFFHGCLPPFGFLQNILSQV